MTLLLCVGLFCSLLALKWQDLWRLYLCVISFSRVTSGCLWLLTVVSFWLRRVLFSVSPLINTLESHCHPFFSRLYSVWPVTGCAVFTTKSSIQTPKKANKFTRSSRTVQKNTRNIDSDSPVKLGLTEPTTEVLAVTVSDERKEYRGSVCVHARMSVRKWYRSLWLFYVRVFTSGDLEGRQQADI